MVRNGVLVIDDDPDFRALVRMVLEVQGLAVFEAENCSAGIEILGRERNLLKLVLLDYFMPGISPAQCASHICALAGTEIDVVLMTAAVDPAHRAAELGLSRWLAKPFDIDELNQLASSEPE
jgi:CheY-like chemotaxis protein